MSEPITPYSQDVYYLQILCEQLQIRNDDGTLYHPSNPGHLDSKTYTAIHKLPTLSRGNSSGNNAMIAIRHIQNVLKIGVDGIFGRETYAAITTFQYFKNLTVNGILDSDTWYAFTNSLISLSNPADKFVYNALRELEVAETPVNKVKYNSELNFSPDAWCAAFVSWCATRGNTNNTIFPSTLKPTAWVKDLKDKYEASNRYRYKSSGYIPKSGDIIIFYDANASAPYKHTGIVVGYANNRIYTIEGNSGDKVSARYHNNQTSNGIQGYCINYGTSSGRIISTATDGSSTSVV